MSNYLLKFIIFLIFFLGCSGYMSDKPIMIYKNGERVKVTGTLMIVGNEPMTKIVLNTNDSQILLPEEIQNTHKNMIGEIISIEGLINAQLIETADHKHSFYQYFMDKPEFK
ncbi:MAG TPA: hypothetical protein PLA54_12105 [Spirochaetota bacterium]|nr:hypothetical protein [Spirochaetota bacterium]HQE59921.1 hypothetical protein [Spirochaetota bacterium]